MSYTNRTPREVGRRAVLVVLCAFAAIAGGGVARGGDTSIGGFPDEGVLRLHLGAQDYFRWDSPAGAGGARTVLGQQPISTSGGCQAVLGTSPALVQLTPTPTKGVVGFFGDSLGVQVKGEGNGQPCGRIDGTTQAVSLKLAGALSGKEIAFAELDLELKFGAVGRVEAYLLGRLVGVKLVSSTSSDNGPDSGDGDNFRVRIEPGVPFDELRITVDATTPGGGVSLEGGSDGTVPCQTSSCDPLHPSGTPSLGAQLVTTDAVFQLTDIDGVLGCGDTVSEGDGLTSPHATLSRLANGDGSACTLLPYTLETVSVGGTNGVTFQKSLDQQPGAQFRMTVTWPVEAALYPPAPTRFVYPMAVGAVPAGTPVEAELCGGTVAAPATYLQPWCIVQQQSSVSGGGTMQVIEEYFGTLDPTVIRTG